MFQMTELRVCLSLGFANILISVLISLFIVPLTAATQCEGKEIKNAHSIKALIAVNTVCINFDHKYYHYTFA